MPFDTLPAELYPSILYYVPPSELQQTILAVSRAIPLSPIPLQGLFRSIRIVHSEQAIFLYRRLRLRTQTQEASDTPGPGFLSELEQIAAWVEELSIESWTVDAEVVINIIRLLQPPGLHTLKIWIGPNNFAPEHLEEVFSKPLLSLRCLSLRFRPYVNKATYYQFLKGAYFDSTLTALTRWPSTVLQTLSITQDPLGSSVPHIRTFAQPIVFFRLDLNAFLRSAAISPALTSFRVRIPGRPVVRLLCGAPSLRNPSDSESMPLPDIEFLDLSTSDVFGGEIDTLLVHFKSLKHIILDGCSILRGDLNDREWHALGKSCATAGVRRAKEREKALKAWLESRSASGEGGAAATGLRNEGRRIKRGRRGLATATISLRDSPDPVPTSSNTQALPHDQSPQFKKSSKGKKKGKIPPSKIRILPSLPTLMSLSVTPFSSTTIEQERHSLIRTEFQEGWADGVAQLAAIRSRLRTSASNGYRVMRVAAVGLESEERSVKSDDSIEDGLEDLKDVDRLDPDTFGMPESLDSAGPVICFAGPGRDGLHETNCGHSVGWEVMKDEM